MKRDPIQTRIDEEGCGAVIGAILAAQADTFPSRTDTPYPWAPSGRVTGDMSGDQGGDAVTSKFVKNQWLAQETTDLGSSAAAVRHLPTCGNIPLETQVKHLKEWYNFPPPF